MEKRTGEVEAKKAMSCLCCCIDMSLLRASDKVVCEMCARGRSSELRRTPKMVFRDYFRHRHERRRDPNQDYARVPGNVQSANEESPPNTQLSKPSAPFPATAICDFNAAHPDECDFIKGDLMQVLDASRQWWRAKNLRTNQEGLIPSDYVTSDMYGPNAQEPRCA
ncbi:Tyrosine-protein kinase HCK [Taenia solium]|eukprot:TsM_001201100 transcript=TsM_001201100 gene=TsM_001201100